MLNHFISELGDPRFAPHKTLFAATLVASAALMIPFCISLGLVIGSVSFWIIAAVGIFASVACALVGFVPENKEQAHLAVAGCFFMGFAVLMMIFVVAILVQPVPWYPAWLVVPTAAVLSIIASFLVDTVRLSKEELARTTRPWDWPNGRPRFWLNPFLEWCAFLSMAAWMGTITIMAL
jgi:hypothetical membrane protein